MLPAGWLLLLRSPWSSSWPSSVMTGGSTEWVARMNREVARITRDSDRYAWAQTGRDIRLVWSALWPAIVGVAAGALVGAVCSTLWEVFA